MKPVRRLLRRELSLHMLAAKPFIMARFDTHTVGSQFIVLPKGLQYEDPKTPEFNYIDTLNHAKLRKLRIIPSEVCSDEEFMRRVFRRHHRNSADG